MIEAFLTYLELLATEHKAFNHGQNNTAYYELDWTGFMSVKRRNDFVLFVHRMEGVLGHNRGDYESDQAVIHFVIFTKVPMKGMAVPTAARFLQCKAYALDFIARMKHDRREADDPDLCALLRHMTLNAVEYEQTELTADGWIGCEVRLPFSSPCDLTFDVSKWNLPETP